MSELDEYLKDFERVETDINSNEWGDALYIRKGALIAPRTPEIISIVRNRKRVDPHEPKKRIDRPRVKTPRRADRPLPPKPKRYTDRETVSRQPSRQPTRESRRSRRSPNA